MRKRLHSLLIVMGLMALIPVAATATDLHERATNTMAAGENGDMHHTSPANTIRESHRVGGSKSDKANDVSAVDMDSSLSTTPAPLGVTNKSDLGVGVEARMPGASGR